MVNNPITPIEDRFWPKVDVRGPDECWPWLASKVAGYGRILAGPRLGGARIWPAHRVSFALAHGASALVPDLEIDHACHTSDPSCVRGAGCPHRACVNPAHLQQVTHEENAVRREARIQACPRGHIKASGNRGPNGASGTKCRVCHREKMRARRQLDAYSAGVA